MGMSLRAACERGGDAGEPLPTPFKQLRERNICFRLGELSMVAAAPGGAKTSFMIRQVHHLSRLGFPVLYFSPDTPKHTVRERCAAMHLHSSLEYIQAHSQNGMKAEVDQAIDQGFSNVRWCFEPIITRKILDEELEAASILFGDYPHLVVIDTLRNLDLGPASDERQSWSLACEYLKKIAYDTNSSMNLCHHLTGPYASGMVEPDLGAIENKIDKAQSLILGLWVADRTGTTLGVTPLKNRSGIQKSTGATAIHISMDLSMMRIGTLDEYV